METQWDWENDKMVDANGRAKEQITVKDLVDRVPGFGDLLKEAREIRDRPSNKDTDATFLLIRRFDGHPHLKERFYKMVGWASNHPDPWVHTSQAYMTAYKALMKALCW